MQEIYIKNLQTKANILREQIGDNQEKLDEINRTERRSRENRMQTLKQAEELKEQLKLGSDWLKEQQDQIGGGKTKPCQGIKAT